MTLNLILNCQALMQTSPVIKLVVIPLKDLVKMIIPQPPQLKVEIIREAIEVVWTPLSTPKIEKNNLIKNLTTEVIEERILIRIMPLIIRLNL